MKVSIFFDEHALAWFVSDDQSEAIHRFTDRSDAHCHLAGYPSGTEITFTTETGLDLMLVQP